MKTVKCLITFLLCLVIFLSFSQNANDCKVLKNGRFKYLDAEDTSAYIVITGNDHTEYHANGKYYIKSKLNWISNCEYIMTMTEITIPDFPFHPGDKMRVVIVKVKGDIIYYTATVSDRKWSGRLKILSFKTKQV